MANANKERLIRVCLDPGHGGKYNPGAAAGYYEGEMTWYLCSRLKEELTKQGVEVWLTKASQKENPWLTTRGGKAKGADLFLSIHSNGASTADPDYPLAICNVDGGSDKPGRALAELVGKEMGTEQPGRIWHKTASSGHGDWYTVLYASRQVGVPGVILEHSFHTNPRACTWLMDRGNLDALAAKEARLIVEYLRGEQYTLPQFVREVQTAIGAAVDGIVGPETLGKTVTVSQHVNPTHPAVRPIQKRLQAMGFAQVGAADGIAGPMFTAAVKAFQATGSGYVDGEITAGNLTWKRLLGVAE